MSEKKISPSLVNRCAGAEETVHAVVELAEQEKPPASLPRAERISAMRSAFEQRAVDVEAVVKEAGGEVMEKAWINQTLSVRLPSEALGRVADLDHVLRLDAPRSLKPES